jgi:predicted Rossmann-fold nucleotide-binding protein
MIIPNSLNQRALIIDMHGYIDGISEELAKDFLINPMFIKDKEMKLVKICKEASDLIEMIDKINKQDQEETYKSLSQIKTGRAKNKFDVVPFDVD